MTRGEVYWADVVPRSGSKQAGRRPVVVVSHDGFNQTAGWKSAMVVPIATSRLQAKPGPTVVSLPAGAAGLSKASVAICHQVTTLDRTKLTARIGVLPNALLQEVAEGLGTAMDLD